MRGVRLKRRMILFVGFMMLKRAYNQRGNHRKTLLNSDKLLSLFGIQRS